MLYGKWSGVSAGVEIGATAGPAHALGGVWGAWVGGGCSQFQLLSCHQLAAVHSRGPAQSVEAFWIRSHVDHGSGSLGVWGGLLVSGIDAGRKGGNSNDLLPKAI